MAYHIQYSRIMNTGLPKEMITKPSLPLTKVFFLQIDSHYLDWRVEPLDFQWVSAHEVSWKETYNKLLLTIIVTTKFTRWTYYIILTLAKSYKTTPEFSQIKKKSNHSNRIVHLLLEVAICKIETNFKERIVFFFW